MLTQDTGPVWGESGGEDGSERDWAGAEPLHGDVVADLCVVGLGGSGLAAVLEASRRGLDVVGVDAGEVAGGAAGRNGGFLLAGTAAFHHDAVVALGRRRATALYRETADEIERMRELTPHLIRPTGSLRIAEDDAELADCEEQYRQMTRDGLPVEPYTGLEGQGLLVAQDCVFDPLARCRYLALAAVEAGARLHERSRVVDFSADSVTTEIGSVRCERVIVAVDGGLERLVPEAASSVRTARLQMLATAPLGRRRFERPVYRRYGYEYYQQLPDGRLALGGFRDRGGDGEWTDDAGTGDKVQSLLTGYLRDELGVAAEVTHRWAASVGFSTGVLPLLANVRGGVRVLGGYSGTGNVIGSLLGRAAVSAVLGESSEVVDLFSDGLWS